VCTGTLPTETNSPANARLVAGEYTLMAKIFLFAINPTAQPGALYPALTRLEGITARSAYRAKGTKARKGKGEKNGKI